MEEAVVAMLTFGCLLAWLRIYRESGEVFRQAEVIVVARLIPITIRPYPIVGGVKDFAAVLRVAEVLKGPSVAQELAVVLHHGLTPVGGDS